MRAVRGSSSTPTSRLPASDSGMPLKNAPVPHDGSSTLPPAKPMASIASHIGRTIPGGV